MAVRVKIANPSSSHGPLSLGYRLLRGLLVVALACLVLGGCVFGYFYFKYQRIVDDRLASGSLFASVSQIYAAPREVRVGQHLTAAFIGQDLRRAGYNANPQLGTFELHGNSIQIKPGPQSYHSTDGATITTGTSTDADASGGSDTVVLSITADNGAPLAAYQLEPQLITALSEDKDRTKRRLVAYNEIPPRLVQAVTSIEDRRFFEHGGVDYHSMIGWAWHDLRGDRKWTGGGSTLTMQLARGIFLSPERRVKRKLIEILITFHLEARFTKQQIFEMYANQINLGHRGSYAINGFGEAAQTFFGKDLRQLDTAQCALLAGMIQSPSRLDPYRHPERAMERRNLVLDAMVETGDLTEAEASRAKAEPLGVTPANIDAGEAPYFVDLVHDQLIQRIGDQEIGHDSLRIYTSLDPELQRAASAAVDAGMKSVDDLVRRRHKKGDTNITYPQVALVALNPHTGQVLALVGGRNYGVSQLDHAVSERPTGSIFKPFVYAAAYNTSVNGMSLGDDGVFTALTRLDDDPRTFMFDGKPYDPGNFERGEFPGMVTAAQAIAHSLNIATIGLAEQIGYENVAALARSAGITNARGTPSVAIGTYNATPIDMAGAYTVFANNGVHLKPWMLASVRNANGDIVADFAPEAKQVMDPRVAYLTQSLLEFTASYGTASAVRAHGFTAPAAGKTGTSHDAWFAGYSSNLLCIIWVGNDDYTDISRGLTHSLQGADTAAPIWAEFMNRAIKLPQYSDMKPFTAPEGVQTMRVDKTTWLPADDSCPEDYYLAFLDGTAPGDTCSHMGASAQSLMRGLLNNGTPNQNAAPTPGSSQPPETPPAPPEAPKKKNFLQKLFGGGDKPAQPAQPATPPQ
jgi:penicillin-binding protein 1B